ncbi:MAG: DNA methylase [Eubacterium sp.]|nr:DNA methylase [Eubacterium sp.]
MEHNVQKTYIAIDLKSFYASVECVERKFDPLTTNLVVADESRTEKTICLAVSPALKAYGIPGRARLFEVIQRVKEVNRKRLQDGIRAGKIRKDETGQYTFTSSSFDANVLAENPNFELGYFAAPPRMKLYEEYSTRIFGIYMKFISPEDIHVYSIDEVFMDVTGYLKTYNMTPHELAMTMIQEVLHATGITATAGIGTNLYLAKVAMDIVAKHVRPDKDGVRIAELDEQTYREKLWCHQPLTDFWRVGRGLTRRLEKLGCHTMGDIARLSETHEDLLYESMGVNAQLLIDHAWGWEPTEIRTIKSYKPESNSLGSGQVLSEPYNAVDGKLIVREMTELLVLDLVRKNLVTRQIVLTVSYDRESLIVLRQGRSVQDTVYGVAKTGLPYSGDIGEDYYGRVCPKHAHGTGNLDRWTSSTRAIMETMMELYDRIVDPDLLIRRLNVVACNLIPETDIPAEGPVQLDLFTDYSALQHQEEERKAAEEKEKRLQKATLIMHERFGKNAVLKGMNLEKKGTTRERNGQIGGHRAGQENAPFSGRLGKKGEK